MRINRDYWIRGGYKEHSKTSMVVIAIKLRRIQLNNAKGRFPLRLFYSSTKASYCFLPQSVNKENRKQYSALVGEQNYQKWNAALCDIFI